MDDVKIVHVKMHDVDDTLTGIGLEGMFWCRKIGESLGGFSAR